MVNDPKLCTFILQIVHNFATFTMTSIIIIEMCANVGLTYTICKVLHGWLRGQKNEKQNNVPILKKRSYRLPVSSENRDFEGCRSTANFSCLNFSLPFVVSGNV